MGKWAKRVEGELPEEIAIGNYIADILDPRHVRVQHGDIKVRMVGVAGEQTEITLPEKASDPRHQLTLISAIANLTGQEQAVKGRIGDHGITFTIDCPTEAIAALLPPGNSRTH